MTHQSVTFPEWFDEDSACEDEHGKSGMYTCCATEDMPLSWCEEALKTTGSSYSNAGCALYTLGICYYDTNLDYYFMFTSADASGTVAFRFFVIFFLALILGF